MKRKYEDCRWEDGKLVCKINPNKRHNFKGGSFIVNTNNHGKIKGLSLC